MGEDNLVQFENWKNYDKILEYYPLLVYSRPNTPPHPFREHPSVKFVEAPLLDISATYIRKCISEGKSIRYLVKDEVADYIRWKGYYL
jgi:nicotinate-nucleotide adenylyltransferase